MSHPITKSDTPGYYVYRDSNVWRTLGEWQARVFLRHRHDVRLRLAVKARTRAELLAKIDIILDATIVGV